MSADRHIDQQCPHEVSEEALYLASDRMTVRPLRPISAVASVRVLLNHTIQAPSPGVYLPGKASGTRRGPFTVTSTTNVFRLSVNQEAPQTVVLPNVNKMGAPQMVALLNQRFTGVVFTESNDRLSFASRDTGPDVSIFLYADSTAATLFGFTVNHEYRGQTSVPGWTLVGDPSSLPDRPTRLIVFDEPLRSASNFVEISYSTVLSECRRCGGTGYEHDWRYDINGNLIEIRDEGLLIQELQKDFYTIRGSNQFHTWYGTGLLDAIGKKLASDGFTQNFIAADIQQAFSRWQKIKTQQEEKIQQEVTDREYPLRLLSVNLEQSTQDPTVIFVNCVVQNRSSDPIQLTRGLRLPQASDPGRIRQSLSGFALSG